MKKDKKTILYSLLGITLLATELATQYFAAQVQYQRALGRPLFMLGKTPIYLPLFFWWWHKFYGDAPRLFTKTLIFMIVMILGFGLILYLKKQSVKSVSPRFGALGEKGRG